MEQNQRLESIMRAMASMQAQPHASSQADKFMKRCDNIMMQKRSVLEHKLANIWIATNKEMLQANRFEWIFAEG